MLWLWIVVLLASGCVSKTPPEPVFRNFYIDVVSGDDHLALQHPKYDVIGAAVAHPPGDAIGFLDYTFGTAVQPVRDYLHFAQVSWVRMHLMNNTCVRNKNCGKYEPLYGYTLASLEAAIARKDPKILGFVRDRTLLWKTFFQTDFPYVGVAVSPILEHNLKQSTWNILAQVVKDNWPGVAISNSSMASTTSNDDLIWVEQHGNTGLRANSKIISTDGIEIMDIDSMKYKKDASRAFLRFRWSRRNNCRDQGDFDDPRRRTNCLKGKESEQQAAVYDEPGPIPKRIFACNNEKDANGNDIFSIKNIWKPLSEDKGTGDQRANLPVFIPSGFKHANAELVTYDGRRVGTLGYYGKYSDGRPRLYSGYPGGSKKTGREFQKAAHISSGYPWVWAKQGSVCRGPFLPGRRQGSYR